MLLIDFQVNGLAAGRPGFSATATLAERLKQFRFGLERLWHLLIQQLRSWNFGLTDGGAPRSGIAGGVPFFLQNFLPEGVHGSGFASALESVARRSRVVRLVLWRCEVSTL